MASQNIFMVDQMRRNELKRKARNGFVITSANIACTVAITFLATSAFCKLIGG